MPQLSMNVLLDDFRKSLLETRGVCSVVRFHSDFSSSSTLRSTIAVIFSKNFAGDSRKARSPTESESRSREIVATPWWLMRRRRHVARARRHLHDRQPSPTSTTSATSPKRRFPLDLSGSRKSL
ncbi:hypothetical protein SCHPADRAFT_525909 [Schizopora paradoxa]|uniref:Uncharacterized protein n=1 Tax=Schizopora paradoxa TaxID=27342 RepID=A0A0H2REP2_9AGAM|nr:hypothetical protein SCHPADRAFT_525909 [Schizopora paradoxa]